MNNKTRMTKIKTTWCDDLKTYTVVQNPELDNTEERLTESRSLISWRNYSNIEQV